MKLPPKLCLILLILGLLLAAFCYGATWFLAPNDLTACGERPSEQPGCQAADVVVSISGGNSRARVASAIELYQAGWAPKLLFSGAALDRLGPSNAETMRDQAVAAGVPNEDIILEARATSTAENAAYAEAILSQLGARDVILVTSPYHQRRAGWLFRSAMPERQVRSHPANDSEWTVWWWTSWRGWRLTLSEVIKLPWSFLTRWL